MASEFWINRLGSSGSWVKATEVWINRTGTSAGWVEATEVWMNIDGTATGWKLVHSAALPNPSFGSVNFRSGVDVDENGFSDENNCDCDTVNEWCFQWNVNDCVAGVHQIQCRRDIGGGFQDHGTLFNCTGGPLGWCTKVGYSGAMLSGANSTLDCQTIGYDFRFELQPQGGGVAYDTVGDYNLDTCASV